MTLRPGLYEQLLTDELAGLREDPRAAIEALGEASADLIARHLHEAARRALEGIGGEDALARQIALANTVIAVLAKRAPEEVEAGDAVLPEVLTSFLPPERVGVGGPPPRPGIPLRHSELIVNGPRDLRVGAEIQKELPSADRVDLLMSFIKWNGFVELRDALAALGKPLRVLTTSYLGATEPEALEGLAELGAEIRVSYDERRTRLHAKAWLFHRDSGYSTAIVGSSNLSHAALRDGCEWNVRVSRRDNPGILSKLEATFAQYWADPAFEPYERERFREAVQPRGSAARDALARVVRLHALPHQQVVLDALEAERESGHRRNLVVAATGTGKTVIAALDYARQPDRPTLLFVAHRDEILEQSLATFRVALRDGNFGEKLTGTDKPILGTHVFASIQSLHAEQLAKLHPEAFSVVIVDEFHHAAAASYTALLQHLRPRLLLGLTATPERADGQSILRWFDDRIAAESRLWDALDQQLLSPFSYFMIHDGTDISQVDFRGGRYDVSSLEQIYTADEHRARAVLRGLVQRVRDPTAMRALAFCVSVKHARYMAAFFEHSQIRARAIHADTPTGERRQAIGALERGEIACLCTVDLFNEGVDLPRVDTVLFLRPTESATIFIQQLGRGLRLHADKPCLTVLDFVGNASARFRFDLRFRALLGGGTRKELAEQIEAGFPRLPSGSAIHLEKRASEVVLGNLRSSLERWAALADELEPEMSLRDFLDRAGIEPEELYRSGKSFTLLRAARGFEPAPGSLAASLCRLLHVDDPLRLAPWRSWLADPAAGIDERSARLLFAAFGQERRPLAELADFLETLRRDEPVRRELAELLAVLADRRRRPSHPLDGLPLSLHAAYTRAEISAAFGLVTDKGKLLGTQAGVYLCEAARADLFFVTLEKDERHFTPTTRYRDFPISPTHFHWQSQSKTREGSETGRRYRAPPPGWRTLLFVRRAKHDARGLTSPFLFLGPLRYESHEGERPMSIVWRLEHPMPADWFGTVKIAAG